MTVARTSAGDKFYITQAPATGGGAGTRTQIKELKTAPAIGGTPSQVDATSLDDTTCKVYVPGLNDYGVLDFTFNAMPYSATDSNLKFLMDTLDEARPCTVEYELANLGVKVTLSNVYVDWQISDASVDAVREITLHVTMANGPAFATL